MTYIEKFKQEHPEMSDLDVGYTIGQDCPHDYGYLINNRENCDFSCKECWNREIPEEKLESEEEKKLLTCRECDARRDDHCNGVREPFVIQDLDAECTEYPERRGKTAAEMDVIHETKPVIKDSGDRTQFETGAVRDMREGKGRCDLMPLEVTGRWMSDNILTNLGMFLKYKNSNDTSWLYQAMSMFIAKRYPTNGTDDCSNANQSDMLLEVAKHFEEGAKKYGENNWQKGIPVHCYIDSAIRHYLKWLRGDNDEPHDRAFVWNIMCCIWEVDYSPRANKEACE